MAVGYTKLTKMQYFFLIFKFEMNARQSKDSFFESLAEIFAEEIFRGNLQKKNENVLEQQRKFWRIFLHSHKLSGGGDNFRFLG